MVSFSILFVLESALYLSCLSSEMWKLNSQGNNEELGQGKKLWSLQVTYGRLYCATLCLQNLKCWYFTYENQICQSFEDKGRRPHLTIFSGSFTRQKELKGQGDGYIQSDDILIKLHYEPKMWSHASEACKAEGATLIKLDPPKKGKLFIDLFYSTKIKNKDDLWIGLTDMHDNDTWYWVDGTKPSNHRGWRPNEPDNIKKGIKENCGATGLYPFIGVKWFDDDCHELYSFVCEKNPKK